MLFSCFRSVRSIRGKIFLPGDKSIAHRSIFISAIAKGTTRIYNFPANQDCYMSLKAFKNLGIKISRMSFTGSHISLCVEGRGLYCLKKPPCSILTGESGTTFRLLLGILAGQPFQTTLTAGQALSHRPMRRITEPLRMMGANIEAQSSKVGRKTTVKHTVEKYPPITIKGGDLHNISYKMIVASAQVKSALLLAGLYTKGTTKILELIKTRDHTERMLKDFGADIKIKNKIVSLRGQKELVSPGRINIPGDLSSASFFIVAAILLPRSHLVIKSVGLNPTRMGVIRVLKRMGANIKMIPSKLLASGSEPVGDIIVRSSSLKGIRIKKSEIPQLIDELPVLMLASCFAKGKTVISGVEELRVKETDRIISMQSNLRKMGADIYVSSSTSRARGLGERIIIHGVGRLKGARVRSFSDHRTAMSMIIAGLVSDGQICIDDVRCIAKSFPDFLKVLKSVVK